LRDRSGVELIDEVDAHLHPEWQREVGFWLKRHFPKIQFLVTTHSPSICQAAAPNGLFVSSPTCGSAMMTGFSPGASMEMGSTLNRFLG
jgi:predicted ATPase